MTFDERANEVVASLDRLQNGANGFDAKLQDITAKLDDIKADVCSLRERIKQIHDTRAV